jgi:hypothetical protein
MLVGSNLEVSERLFPRPFAAFVWSAEDQAIRRHSHSQRAARARTYNKRKLHA